MDELCWLCKLRPIKARKRPLCWICYFQCLRKGLLHIFPLTDNGHTLDKTVKKYGVGFREDMDILKSGKTTLACLGEKYGISRERVRQLYPIFFGVKYTTVVSGRTGASKIKRENNHAETQEKRQCRIRLREQSIKAFQDFDNRLKRCKKNGPSYIGMIAEHLFREKCKSLGYGVEMQKGGHVFDAKVNGMAVDVKSRTTAVIYSERNKQPYYHFHTKEIQRKEVKFFAAYLHDEDSWYIFPSNVMKGNVFHIPKYNVTGHGCHAYRDLQQYREAWHLLKLLGGKNSWDYSGSATFFLW